MIEFEELKLLELDMSGDYVRGQVSDISLNRHRKPENRPLVQTWFTIIS